MVEKWKIFKKNNMKHKMLIVYPIRIVFLHFNHLDFLKSEIWSTEILHSTPYMCRRVLVLLWRIHKNTSFNWIEGKQNKNVLKMFKWVHTKRANYTLWRRLKWCRGYTSTSTTVLVQLTEIHSRIVDSFGNHLYHSYRKKWRIRKVSIIEFVG